MINNLSSICLKKNFMNLLRSAITLELDIMKRQKRIFKIKGIMNIFIDDVYH